MHYISIKCEGVWFASDVDTCQSTCPPSPREDTVSQSAALTCCQHQPPRPAASAQQRVSWSKHAETVKSIAERHKICKVSGKASATTKHPRFMLKAAFWGREAFLFFTRSGRGTPQLSLSYLREEVMAHNESLVALNGTQVSFCCVKCLCRTPIGRLCKKKLSYFLLKVMLYVVIVCSLDITGVMWHTVAVLHFLLPAESKSPTCMKCV